MVFIAVVGGCGFIGSHIVDMLLLGGHKVRVIDNLITGNKDNIKEALLNPLCEFVYCDICDIGRLRRALSGGIEMINIQAAIGSVKRSFIDPELTHSNNVDGFVNLLVCAKEMGIKKIVYASSSSVYGDTEVFPNTVGKEGKCLSIYALSKLIDEKYANMFCGLYKLPVIGLRYFNVFGARQNPLGEYAAVIPKFVNSIIKDEECYIYGDGTISRDFTYIDNVVSANVKALFCEDSDNYGKVFNVGCGGTITITKLYNLIYDIISEKMERVRKLQYMPGRIGELPFSTADISLTVEGLGYEVLKNVDEGLRLYIDGIIKTLQ